MYVSESDRDPDSKNWNGWASELALLECAMV